MFRTTPISRQRGSALVVTITTLAIVLVLGGLLVTIPQASFTREIMNEEKQLAYLAADAGVRDGFVYIMANYQSNAAGLTNYTSPTVTFGAGKNAQYSYQIKSFSGGTGSLSQGWVIFSTGTSSSISGDTGSHNGLVNPGTIPTVTSKIECVVSSKFPPPPFVPGAFSVEDKSGSSVTNTGGAAFDFRLNGVTGVINGNDNAGANGALYGGTGAPPVEGVAFGSMPNPTVFGGVSGGGSSANQILGAGGPPSIQYNASMTPGAGQTGASIDDIYNLVDTALQNGTAQVVYTSSTGALGNGSGDTLGGTNHIATGARGSFASPVVTVIRPQAYPCSTANLLDITGDCYGIFILDLNWGYGSQRKDASGNPLPDSFGPAPTTGANISPFNIGSPAYPVGGVNMTKDLFCMDGASGSLHGMALIDSGSGSMNWSGQHLFELNGNNDWSGAVNIRMNGPMSGALSGHGSGSPVILANLNGHGKIVYSAEDLSMAMGALGSSGSPAIAVYMVIQ